MSVNEKMKAREQVIAVIIRGKKKRTIKPSMWNTLREKLRRVFR